MTPREQIVCRGGPFDGLEGSIHPESSRMGFAVMEQAEMWYGYWDSGERTADGRRIFQLGKPQRVPKP